MPVPSGPLTIDPAVGADALALWVTPDDVTGTDATPEQLAAAARVATDVLYALSGRRWPGVRSDQLLVAPTAGAPRVPMPTPLAPTLGSRTRGCGCHTSTLDPQLPSPVVSVSSLQLADGTVVPPGQVQVLDRRLIAVTAGDDVTDPLAVNYWTDGEGFYALFPYGEVECGRARRVQLTVVWGVAPPEAGAAAALQLATEVAKGLSGGNCRIAGNVTNVNRQGVSVLLDASTFLDKGRTGVPLVDLWLSAVNPKKLARPAEVWWPEADTPLRLS